MPHRRVFIDPDGTLGDYLFLLTRAPTGVVYETQCGGTANNLREAEGYLVPLAGSVRLGADAFRSGRLAEAIAQIPYWTASDRLFRTLDESHLPDAEEAWLPVLTPDGPAILLWPNSD